MSDHPPQPEPQPDPQPRRGERLADGAIRVRNTDGTHTDLRRGDDEFDSLDEQLKARNLPGQEQDRADH